MPRSRSRAEAWRLNHLAVNQSNDVKMSAQSPRQTTGVLISFACLQVIFHQGRRGHQVKRERDVEFGNVPNLVAVVEEVQQVEPTKTGSSQSRKKRLPQLRFALVKPYRGRETERADSCKADMLR